MIKIGIFGGTFDPPHFGHINLALQIMEARNLEEVWFCPVRISPHKQHLPPTPIEQRLEMLRLAIASVPRTLITEVEIRRPGPSYTIDTINNLLSDPHNRDIRFSLILGDDALPNFCKWHKPQEIVNKVPIWIGRRLPQPISVKDCVSDPEIAKALEKGVTDTKLMDITATEIRSRLSKGLYCGHLVPEKVLDYIYKNKLY